MRTITLLKSKEPAGRFVKMWGLFGKKVIKIGKKLKTDKRELIYLRNLIGICYLEDVEGLEDVVELAIGDTTIVIEGKKITLGGKDSKYDFFLGTDLHLYIHIETNISYMIDENGEKICSGNVEEMEKYIYDANGFYLEEYYHKVMLDRKKIEMEIKLVEDFFIEYETIEYDTNVWEEEV